jgi:hypothetical protein
MKWTALACATPIAGCANSPPVDNRSAPGTGQPAVDETREARGSCETQAAGHPEESALSTLLQSTGSTLPVVR